jgi:hypothetical protein
MMDFHLNFLHHRMILFRLLPVTVRMFTVELFGWGFARGALLEQRHALAGFPDDGGIFFPSGGRLDPPGTGAGQTG